MRMSSRVNIWGVCLLQKLLFLVSLFKECTLIISICRDTRPRVSFTTNPHLCDIRKGMHPQQHQEDRKFNNDKERETRRTLAWIWSTLFVCWPNEASVACVPWLLSGGGGSLSLCWVYLEMSPGSPSPQTRMTHSDSSSTIIQAVVVVQLLKQYLRYIQCKATIGQGICYVDACSCTSWSWTRE